MQTLTIQHVEHNCKLQQDIRIEKDNKRICIYEVIPFKQYAIIIKVLGEVVKFATAQNSISLLIHSN